jgi:hypothetical protein
MPRLYGPIDTPSGSRYIERVPRYASFMWAEWWDGWRYRWTTVGCDATGTVVATTVGDVPESEALQAIGRPGVNDYVNLQDLIVREGLNCRPEQSTPRIPEPLPTVPYTAIDRNIDWKLASAAAISIALVIYIAYLILAKK